MFTRSARVKLKMPGSPTTYHRARSYSATCSVFEPSNMLSGQTIREGRAGIKQDSRFLTGNRTAMINYLDSHLILKLCTMRECWYLMSSHYEFQHQIFLSTRA